MLELPPDFQHLASARAGAAGERRGLRPTAALAHDSGERPPFWSRGGTYKRTEIQPEGTEKFPDSVTSRSSPCPLRPKRWVRCTRARIGFANASATCVSFPAEGAHLPRC